MPLSASAIVVAAIGLQYDSLSDRDLMLCLVGYYSAAAGMTAATCLPLAIAAGYDALSDQQLDQCLLDTLS